MRCEMEDAYQMSGKRADLYWYIREAVRKSLRIIDRWQS